MKVVRRFVLISLVLAAGFAAFPNIASAHHGGFHWNSYGGAPYQWTTSKEAAANLVLSSRGTFAARRLGISPSCWSKVRLHALNRSMRTERLFVGQHFDGMIWGSGTVEHNVILGDRRAAGVPVWTITVDCGGRLVKIWVPTCGNIAITSKPAPKPVPKPRPIPNVPCFVKKHAFVNGQAVNQPFTVRFRRNGGFWKNLTIRSSGQPVSCGSVIATTRVEACEVGLPPGFTVDGRRCRVRIARRGGTVIFIFINQKVTPPQKAPVAVENVTESSTGHPITLPTNVFIAHVTCDGTTVSAPLVQNPQVIRECTVGGPITVCETLAPGQEQHWEFFPPTCQPFTATAAGVKAVFKKRQRPPVAPPPPTQPPARQVSVELCCLQQLRPTGQAWICATPRGFTESTAQLRIRFFATGMIEPFPTTYNRPEGEACVRYNAADRVYTDTIRVEVTDSQGNRAEDTQVVQVHT